MQQAPDSKRRYIARFGSGNWNERESNYSQPKIELYGLFRTLKAVQTHILGVKRLIVEVDAKYIKGMINNPDVQPNATINRWIAGILLFDFELVHVPATKHTGADGLSRRPAAPEDQDKSEDYEEWIDKSYAFVLAAYSQEESAETVIDIPRRPGAEAVDRDLERIRDFLENPRRPADMSDQQFKRFVKKASRFFVQNGTLWRKHVPHSQVVPAPDKRYRLMQVAHDELGHKGMFTVRLRLQHQFQPKI